MSTASISGSFDIVLRPTGVATNWTVANLGSGGSGPGRTFRVQQVLVTGSGGAGYAITTRKNSGAGAVCAVYTEAVGGAFVDAPATITEANTVFSATDNIYVSAAGGGGLATTSKVIIRCIAADAQALTVT